MNRHKTSNFILFKIVMLPNNKKKKSKLSNLPINNKRNLRKPNMAVPPPFLHSSSMFITITLIISEENLVTLSYMTASALIKDHIFFNNSYKQNKSLNITPQKKD